MAKYLYRYKNIKVSIIFEISETLVDKVISGFAIAPVYRCFYGQERNKEMLHSQTFCFSLTKKSYYPLNFNHLQNCLYNASFFVGSDIIRNGHF